MRLEWLWFQRGLFVDDEWGERMTVRGSYNPLLYLRFWICLVRKLLLLSGNSSGVLCFVFMFEIQSFRVFLDRLFAYEVFLRWLLFLQVLSENDVDPVRTTSNDICEIFSVSENVQLLTNLARPWLSKINPPPYYYSMWIFLDSPEFNS